MAWRVVELFGIHRYFQTLWCSCGGSDGVTDRLCIMPTTVGKKRHLRGVFRSFLCALASAGPAGVVGGGPCSAASAAKRWAAGRAQPLRNRRATREKHC